MTLPERITKRINKSGECWTWGGTHNNHGYGMTWWEDRMRVVHQLVYLDQVGPIPGGLELDHLCRNKGCCNPAHLEPVTHAENLRRHAATVTKPTHCPHGHEFTPENTYNPPGTYKQVCRACQRIGQQKWLARRAAGLIQKAS